MHLRSGQVGQGEMARRSKAGRSAEPVQAIAYLRTSSAANVGTDRDSDKRQREAIQSFARSAG